MFNIELGLDTDTIIIVGIFQWRPAFMCLAMSDKKSVKDGRNDPFISVKCERSDAGKINKS